MKKGNKIRRVAVIGSQGVPPIYGGFETLVDNIIGCRNPKRVSYTVFCSKPDMKTDLSQYKGATLKYVGLHAHGAMSVPYDIVSMIKSVRGYDAILILGVSGGVFVPVLRLLTRAKIIVNVDGLEHLREKWKPSARRFLKFSLEICLKWAHEIVSDNRGIYDYIQDTYGRKARLIAYGGDHALRNVTEQRQQAILDFYGLERGKYDLSVCRIEPENNCHLSIEAYSGTSRKIVIIGNWNHSDYSRNLYNRYKDQPYVRMIKQIYDLDILYALRKNSRYYVHGHRAGGTNPSLVEAMFFKKPIVAFDVVYNRETTQGQAHYYSDAETLRRFIDRDDQDATQTYGRARKEYVWKRIGSQYEELY